MAGVVAGERRSAQPLQGTAMEMGLELFPGRPEMADISGLFTISCFSFTTAGGSIHCTDAWGRGKVLQVVLFSDS